MSCFHASLLSARQCAARSAGGGGRRQALRAGYVVGSRNSCVRWRKKITGGGVSPENRLMQIFDFQVGGSIFSACLHDP